MAILGTIIIVVTSILFQLVPLPRPFGAPGSDRREIIFWTVSAVWCLLGMVVAWGIGHRVDAVLDGVMFLISVAYLWHYIRRTRRGKRVAKLIGAKARALRDALVRVQREAERALRGPMPDPA